MPAFSAGGRVDDAVDQGRPAGFQTGGEGVFQFLRRGGIVSRAAEGFDQFVISGRRGQGSGRGIAAAAEIGIVAAVNAAVVKNDDRYRQFVTADSVD